MKPASTRQQVRTALAACEEKKAENITILEMDQAASAFTDYFVICSGTNPRQVQAIADEVDLRLKREGQIPTHIEGYQKAEWVLLDYLDFVVHVFAPSARAFYDLERLWKGAKHMTPAELAVKPTKAAATKAPATKKQAAAKPAARKAAKSKASTRSRSAKRRVRRAS
ncbi:MAG: ribosome silencing factor [Candidatus Koribacter versatilis]|uniref:Ribosomal silencing factor RsfS n=1 Tax=Candidatus Korobacter versatilis TaxID=658062 RepID=A0A932EPG6_9BACT|nr:ribosome silencing factor [Candidatus Koribacter versatilis]